MNENEIKSTDENEYKSKIYRVKRAIYESEEENTTDLKLKR